MFWNKLKTLKSQQLFHLIPLQCVNLRIHYRILHRELCITGLLRHEESPFISDTAPWQLLEALKDETSFSQSC